MSTLDIIKKYKLSTRKQFGQNFLVDSFLLNKIVSVAGNIEGNNILEIGPGPGGLTQAILNKNPKKLVSVEIDKNLYEIVKKEFSDYSNFEIINKDALKINEADYLNDKIDVIANLPYNVGTTLLIKWIENLGLFNSFTLLLQKEVVDRIVAVSGTKDYGRLSVIIQALCIVKKAFDVKPTFFIPPPKVMSSVVHIVPKPNWQSINIKKLSQITFTLFNSRRKKIKKALESLINSGLLSEKALEIVDVNKRAEDLNVNEFIKLSNI